MPIQKLLLAEGDAAARSAATALIQQATTWEVLIANDAAEAKRLTETTRPDLLLLSGDWLAALGTDFPTRLGAAKSTARVVVLISVPPEVGEVPGAPAVRKPFDATLPGQLRTLFEAGRLKLQLARLDDIGGADFVREMIDLFLEHSPPRIVAARAALTSGDLATVAQSAHPLKSSAGNLGADSVQSLAEQIEQLASAGTREPLPELLTQLEGAFARVKVQMEHARGELS